MEAATDQVQRFQWPGGVRFVVELGLSDRKMKKQTMKKGEGGRLMMHNPTYRFRNQGAELRAQTEEKGHCCSSMIESGDATAKFAHISPPTPISTIHVNSPTVPMSARYSTYISDMTVRNVRNGHGGQMHGVGTSVAASAPMDTRNGKFHQCSSLRDPRCARHPYQLD